MSALLLALAVLAGCAALSLALRRLPPLAGAVGALGPLAAFALALRPSLDVLAGAAPLSARVDWTAPVGPLLFGLDPLSAFFLLVILGVSALAAVYGLGYLHRTPQDATSWSWFGLLVASMAVVVLARQAILFLLAWETMALSSFLLVAHHHERPEVRRAAWTYLVAMHLGACFLLPMFFVLARSAGSLDFAAFGQGLTPAAATAGFLLAVVGFGTKAGLMPFHVWLPEAHPAAPSHVSALMSGVMIKTGVYGLARMLLVLGTPRLSWGLLLLALGGVSALLGVLFALAQHDLKRLLAYHSVENVGIIVLGLGVGVTGLALGAPAVAALGFAGGLLHVLNHALFKGLLFLGAGAVLRALVHSLNHSLAKSVAFWSVGRLGQAFGSHDVARMSGAFRGSTVWGVGLLASFVALTGAAPFATFLSELAVLRAAFQGGRGIVFALVLASLALAFVGLLRHAIRLAWGPSEVEPRRLDDRLLDRALVALTLLALVGLGFGWPGPLLHAAESAARVVNGEAALVAGVLR